MRPNPERGQHRSILHHCDPCLAGASPLAMECEPSGDVRSPSLQHRHLLASGEAAASPGSSCAASAVSAASPAGRAAALDMAWSLVGTTSLEPQKVLEAHCAVGQRVKRLPPGEPVKKMPPAWLH